MADIKSKTRFGLPTEYYNKHVKVGIAMAVLGGIFAIVFTVGMLRAPGAEKDIMFAVAFLSILVFMLVCLALNAILYPYSRYVFDLLQNWLMGDGITIAPLITIWLWRFFKFWVLPSLLFIFTYILAPVGIIILKIQKLSKKDEHEPQPLNQ